jgi:D-alanine-D-alanine ligase
MRQLRVLAMMHEDLVPPESVEGMTEEQIAPFKTEYDIMVTLEEDLGHQARCVGLNDDLSVLRHAIDTFKPHIVFNILEEFDGKAVFDQHVVSYLELLRVPYTGGSPLGLTLARDKGLSKRILASYGLPVPKFAVFPMGQKVRRPPEVGFPLFVKSVNEEASLGISRASIVRTDQQLQRRVAFVHESVGTDAIAEQYVEGRELYVAILGNERLQVFPVWELRFTKAPSDVPVIATSHVKWSLKYQKRHGVMTGPARNLSKRQEAEIKRICKQAYRVLGLTGYGRVDLRMADDGQVYIIEVNPNPQLMYGEDFAESAHHAGVTYEKLIQRILNLGLRRARR